jgi:uncharacterized protein YukJ
MNLEIDLENEEGIWIWDPNLSIKYFSFNLEFHQPVTQKMSLLIYGKPKYKIDLATKTNILNLKQFKVEVIEE